MLLKLDSKRRLTIPAKLVAAKPGDYFEALYDEDEDKIVFRRVKRKRNWLEVWKQCPVSMDDIPPRSRELPKKIKL
jgi:bifunctional DNA-binding transcriptional regulator/antitoxin component of YhaV-PrlF toxin-antitoxin module